MTGTPALAAAWLLVSATVASAAPPPAGVPVAKGDTVTFELTALPDRFEGEATATCTGTRIDATGPVDARCERTFRFELPPGDARMTYLFKPATGKERGIVLPITRERKPVSFVAPSDGTLLAPQPIVFPPEKIDAAARAAAGPQCDLCQGVEFRLVDVKVTRQPIPPGGALPVKIGITTPGKR